PQPRPLPVWSSQKMRALFADTSFFVAFISPIDEQHAKACSYMDHHSGPITSTNWVLAELGNLLRKPEDRSLFAPLVRGLHRDKRFVILSAHDELFEEALALYDRRADKEWSFTDCTSIVVMNDQKLTTALTTDHHFEQA